MKVGDLVKVKCPWKNIEYSPQNDNDGVGILIKFYREGVIILWSRGCMGWLQSEKIRVISEGR